jgi:ABC-2 type transport system ATP-binding protein
MSTAIVADKLSKRFKNKSVFEQLSLSVEAGSVFGLVGLNGAGKTTLIRLLLGLLKPDSGSFSVLDTTPRAETRFYRDIGVALEHNGFYGNLTVAQNVSLFAEAKHIDQQAARDYFHTWWRETSIDRPGVKSKVFSRGQKMQCALCRAFLGWPRALFLDEPAVALDVNAYDHFCRLVRHARERGAAVIISSHQLDAIEDLCDSVGILEAGALSMLDMSAMNGHDIWLVRSPFSEQGRAIIDQFAEGTSRYDNGAWRFLLPRSNRARIPELVRSLVHAGCAIEEVRPVRRGFRESIRRYYDSAGRSEESLS